MSIKFPKSVMAVFGALALAALIQIPSVVIDTDPENMLSEDEEVRLNHKEVKKNFGLYDSLVLGIFDSGEGGVFTPDTLNRIAKITEEIALIDGVIGEDIISPTTTDDISAGLGGLKIQPLMAREVETVEEAEAVREKALSNPVLKDMLISGDGNNLSIFVPIEEKDQSYRIGGEIREIIERVRGEGGEEGAHGTEEYHLTGLPVAEDTFGVEMFKQMAVAAPLAGLLIFVLMYLFFRRLLLITSAMVVAMGTVIITMGLLIGLGFTVHIMSSMIPIFLMPIAVVDSIHILSDFHERHGLVDHSGKVMSREETIFEIVEELFTPMIFTTITSAVGFVSLISTPIPPVQVFGAFVAFGIVVAWGLTMTVLPAFTMLIPARALQDGEKGGESKEDLLYRVQERLGAFAIKRSKVVISLSLVLFVLMGVGVSKLVVNDNPVRWFSPDHPIRVADDLLNREFGGTYISYLVLKGEREGAFKDPEALRYVESLQSAIDGMDHVGKSTSVADLLKKISFELHNEAEDKYILPDTSRKAAQFYFLYEMAGDPDDLYHLVTPDYESINLWVQLKSGDNMAMRGVATEVARFMEKNPPPPSLNNLTTTWAGLTYLNVVWQDRMVTGMLKALGGGAVTVLIIMMLLFRSTIWGAISMLPLTLTIGVIYGLIGYVGKDFDMPIAVLSALTLGISIDFAIHMIQRTRQIRVESESWEETVIAVFDEPVRAILRNMVVISVGFMPLLLSPLVPYKTVGFFFAMIMAVSGIATLLLLPALMNTLRGRLRL